RGSRGRDAFTHTPRIVLIHVNAYVQRRDAPEDHQRFVEWATECVLSEADFVLENGALEWGPRRQPLDIDFVLVDGCLRLYNLTAGNHQVRPPGSSFGQSEVPLRLRETSLRGLVILAPPKHLLFGHGLAVLREQAFNEINLDLGVRQEGLRLRDFCF